MKIAVVSYNELNEKPSETKVINDVISFYEEADERTLKKMGSVLRSQLEELSGNGNALISYIATEDPVSRAGLVELINNIRPDLTVSYNLAGFEQTTLTDGLAYNLVNSRQVHLVERDELPIKQQDDVIKSINIIFG